MRLLNCRTRTLEYFLEDPLSYQHETKAGWYKIQKSCDQALRDGWDYLWADTLCIDKSSSSELSESINSMFKWYRDSAVCYAYLSDVLPDGGDFEKSRWFSRGWTLQELIAPGELKFYGRHWDFIGLKSAMLDQLHSITAIDPTGLQGGSLRLLSVAQKMSWASRRQTTRPEDMAYCLLGIFNTSMPMLYGEGSRAFVRLQEQNVRDYDDQTLFAWVSSGHREGDQPTGVFATSPAAFACSAKFYPCQPRWSNEKQFDPITVSNRGVQFMVPARKLDPRDAERLGAGHGYEVFHMQLACKEVGFDMKPRLRAGIYLTKRFGTGNTWSRIRPTQLPPFESWEKYKVKAFFALKERSPLQDLVLRGSSSDSSAAFWARTMPTGAWPYRLAFTYPPHCWDEKNNMFRGQHLGKQEPFVLGFRKSVAYDTAGETQNEKSPSSYFLVFFGMKEPEQPQAGEWSKQHTWCQVKYVEQAVLTAENVDLVIQDLDKEAVVAMSERGGDKQFLCEGDGWLLKCYVQLEVVWGQHLFCADMHLRET
ncbi:uncharacterized protein PG986_013315 [Apiospora aurea]|uniref:Heterokaryon incompatibility domain-containing protein n=1 Tax=Apiospora aurea TaxID=335848 RepID=A0ABR1PVI7_9PEZI